MTISSMLNRILQIPPHVSLKIGLLLAVIIPMPMCHLEN